jgi:hypothetical protein
MNPGLDAVNVDLQTVEAQDAAQGSQAAGSRFVRCAEGTELEADAADGHSANPCATRAKPLGALAAELAGHADPHAVVSIHLSVRDQEGGPRAAARVTHLPAPVRAWRITVDRQLD